MTASIDQAWRAADVAVVHSGGRMSR
jgi:hypothetical protein